MRARRSDAELDSIDLLRLARALQLDAPAGGSGHVERLAEELRLEPSELLTFGRRWADEHGRDDAAPAVRGARAHVVATLRGEAT